MTIQIWPRGDLNLALVREETSRGQHWRLGDVIIGIVCFRACLASKGGRHRGGREACFFLCFGFRSGPSRFT